MATRRSSESDVASAVTNPMQQSLTVIEIRPFRGGWQCYEGPSVQLYWTSDTAKEDTLDYATAPAKFEPANFASSFSVH